MNKIINEIILNSISFDDNIKSRNYCKLSELHEYIKNDIYDFGMLVQLKELDLEDIYNLLKKIIKLNELIINRLNQKNHVESKIDITKKTLILFYKVECEISIFFLEKWFKLKEIYRSKYNFLTVNIEVPKYKKLIDIFNVKSTSLICLINNDIYKYNGKIAIKNIINFLNTI